MKTTVVLGAGFSNNSNIPVMSELPKMILDSSGSSFEEGITSSLRKFFRDIFGYNGGESIPSFDDLLTCIDLSTNSGHHLGIDYSPLHLRSLRRFLMYRVFSLMERPFEYSENTKELVDRLISRFEEISFVVLNWDTVLEKYILELSETKGINYCNGSLSWREDGQHYKESIRVLKVHGSCNWLYCDNCRSVFYDLYEDIPIIKRAGFKERDLGLIKAGLVNNNSSQFLGDVKCRICSNNISSHIATFSYRKSFRANSFPDIWGKAEKELAGSDRWVFVGYSLPDADYEFKHLLKVSQLKLRHIKASKLRIDVVLLDGSAAIPKYRSFFGDSLGEICDGGIKSYLELI